MSAATVVALHLSHASRAPLTAVDRAEAVENHGLHGDRHAKPGNRRSILLVEQEVLDHHGLAAGDIREQMTVRGLDLNSLPSGSHLRIGSALLEVGKPCDPCDRMDQLRQGLRKQLEGRRGRFVKVVEGGTVAVGDTVQVQPAT